GLVVRIDRDGETIGSTLRITGRPYTSWMYITSPSNSVKVYTVVTIRWEFAPGPKGLAVVVFTLSFGYTLANCVVTPAPVQEAQRNCLTYVRLHSSPLCFCIFASLVAILIRSLGA